MTLQFPPIIIFYLAIAGILWFVAYHSWQMRPTRGAQLWAITMVALGFMAFMDGIAIMQVELNWRLVCEYIILLAGAVTIYCWSLFMLRYSQFDRWHTSFSTRLLAVIPIALSIVVLTASWHNLVFTSTEMVFRNNYYRFHQEYGIGFWLWLIYAYTVMFGGLALLIISIARYPRMYQGQVAILVIASLAPFIAIGINLLFDPLDGYDISSFGFMITGILIYIGMKQFQLLNVVPVAHDLVIKSTRNGVIILDDNDTVVDINPAVESILKLAKSDVIGKAIQEVFPQYTADVQDEDIHEEYRTEIILNQKHYEMQIMPLINRVDEQSGKLVILHDISEQKRYLDELDAYAHTVAHDLKNPLGIISSFTDILRTGRLGEFSPEVEEILAIMADSTGKMRTIIDNLLMLATVRNAEEIDLHPLDTSKIITEVLKRLDQSIKVENAKITTVENWHVSYGYEPWIEEVWINYMTNALKYGGSPPVIELGSDKLENGFIRYWVKDNGPGLSIEEQSVLFAKHTRLEQHSDLAGHGLGLSIVQRIINKLGGQVGVESTLGEGSLFYFTLPETRP